MGAGNVAVLAYSYWQQRFQSNTNVVGSTIRLNGQAFTVIGVASEEFSSNSALMKQTLFIPLTGADFVYPEYSKTLATRYRTGSTTSLAVYVPV